MKSAPLSRDPQVSCTIPSLVPVFAFQVSAGYHDFVSSLQHLTSLPLLCSSAIFCWLQRKTVGKINDINEWGIEDNG